MPTKQRFSRISDQLIAEGFLAIVKAYPSDAPLGPSATLARLIRAGLHGLSKLPPEEVRAAWEAAEVRSGWPIRGEVLSDDA